MNLQKFVEITPLEAHKFRYNALFTQNYGFTMISRGFI